LLFRVYVIELLKKRQSDNLENMELQFFKTKNSLRNWRVLFVPTFLYLFVGVLAFAVSYENYLVLNEIFAITLLVSGVLEIVFFFKVQIKAVAREGAMTGAILDFIMAFLLWAYPETILSFLPFYMGIWVLFRGIMAIIFSFKLNLFGNLDWLWLLLYVLAIFNFFFLLFWNSFTGTLNASQITGLAFMAVGAFRLFWVFDLKMVHGFETKYRQIGLSNK